MLVLINKNDYLNLMHFNKEGVAVVAAASAIYGGTFAFIFGLAVGRNGVDKVEPTSSRTEIIIPYTQVEQLKCLGDHALKLSFNGDIITMPVERCDQANFTP